MHWFYYAGRTTARVLLVLLTRWQVNGKDNVPHQGPLLVVANHLSLADPALLGASLERGVVFMAKKELFRFGVFRYFLRGLGAFPIHRGRLDREALRQVDRVLAQGLALIMFPEGMRSRSGKLRPAFRGSALIATRCGAPVLPVGIVGTDKIKSAAWVLRRPRITVNIGHPFYMPQATSKLTKAELDQRTRLIMGHIAELLPPEYRGSYGG